MEPEWNYTITLFGQTVQGKHTVTAPTEQQAVRKVVFRELKRKYPADSDTQRAAKALPLVNRIIENQSYTVNRQELAAPTGVEVPTRHSVMPPAESVESIPEDIKQVRRGLGDYPENPDEEEQHE